MYLFKTLDPHPPTATPISGQSPKKNGFYWMVIFTKKFRTLDPHLPIVWDKVLKINRFFLTPSLMTCCLNASTKELLMVCLRNYFDKRPSWEIKKPPCHAIQGEKIWTFSNVSYTFSSLTGGPNWPFKCLDLTASIRTKSYSNYVWNVWEKRLWHLLPHG